MPLNHTKLEKRLSDCDEKLTTLETELKKISTSEEVKRYFNEIKNYYNLSYNKAKKNQTAEAVVKTYEEYTIHLENVKDGSAWYTTGRYSFKEASNSLEKASDAIVYANDARKLGIIRHNLANICALMFWASAALALYASVYLIAMPMLLVYPVLGYAMGITIGGFFLQSAIKAFSCCFEFKGFTRHSAEYEHERKLLSLFFKPAQNLHKQETPEQEETAEQEETDIESCRL
jgi:hypothetical protein